MKILIVLPNDSLGGAEQYLKLLASYHQDKSVTIYFLKNNKTNQWKNLEAHTHQHFMSGTHELLGLVRFILTMLFKHPKYDYAYSSHTKINALLGLLRRFRILKINYLIVRESTSIFLRYQGAILRYYKFLYAIGYNKIDLIICQTELMRAQFKKHNPKISKKTIIEVIPNPIDLSNANKKALENTTKTLDFDYIISAGRLIKLKGFDILINAFSQVKKQHPNLKLVLLGEGTEKDHLVNLSKELQLENEVIFLGHVSNVYGYFKKAKLCAVSSIMEGFPNVLLQMMSQNDRVVSTLCAGGIEDIDGVFTCSINNEDTLSAALIECLIADTSANKELFNAYLDTRTIDSFMQNVTNRLKTI